MIKFRHKGDFSNTERFFERAKELFKRGTFNKYGELGVRALSQATPKRTGKTAASWTYEISHGHGGVRIDWINTNTNKGEVIAVLLQYGHGTGTGGYVVGTDYINPAMRPIFDQIADDAWKEVVGK